MLPKVRACATVISLFRRCQGLARERSQEAETKLEEAKAELIDISKAITEVHTHHNSLVYMITPFDVCGGGVQVHYKANGFRAPYMGSKEAHLLCAVETRCSEDMDRSRSNRGGGVSEVTMELRKLKTELHMPVFTQPTPHAA